MARRVAIFEDNAEPEAGWVCKQHAADHFEYLEANRDTIRLAGGLRPDSDQWWNGGLWVMEVETRAQGQVADLCRCGAFRENRDDGGRVCGPRGGGDMA